MTSVRDLAQGELNASIEAAKEQHAKCEGTSEITLEKRIQQYIGAPTLLTLAIYDLIDTLKGIKPNNLNQPLSDEELNKILYPTNTKT